MNAPSPDTAASVSVSAGSPEVSAGRIPGAALIVDRGRSDHGVQTVGVGSCPL